MGKFFSGLGRLLSLLSAGLLTASLVNAQNAYGAAPDSLALEYPELSVVPRASDRVKDEAGSEQERGWRTQKILLTSAALTMVSGAVGYNSLPENPSPDDRAASQTFGNAAAFVGAAWIVTASWLAKRYTPYQDGWEKIEKLPNGTQKEQLNRERLAEEALAAPAGLGKKITIMATVSNFLINLGVFGSSGEAGRQAAAIGALAAFAPLVFPYHWQTIHDQHQLYKKKIYGPVVSNSIIKSPQGELLPAMSLQWGF